MDNEAALREDDEPVAEEGSQLGSGEEGEGEEGNERNRRGASRRS
jgi:hypothetical protein